MEMTMKLMSAPQTVVVTSTSFLSHNLSVHERQTDRRDKTIACQIPPYWIW